MFSLVPFRLSSHTSKYCPEPFAASESSCSLFEPAVTSTSELAGDPAEL